MIDMNINKNMEVNVIGYGNWGSRLAKKLEQDGHQIKNLVTNKKDIYVKCKNVYARNQIEQINEDDKELPTFILTGPLYHHEIIPLFNTRVFVEKPFFLKNKKDYNLKFNPYVNYLWYNSTKIKKIKELISNDFTSLNVDFFSSNNIDRGLGIVEDFLPHIITFLKSFEFEKFNLVSINEKDDFIYEAIFKSENKIITFNFGFSNRTYTKFFTDTKTIESSSYDSIIFNQSKILIEENLLSESIERYYKYYLTGECESVFISNDFHSLVHNLTYR
jgi:hypothetical protein